MRIHKKHNLRRAAFVTLLAAIQQLEFCPNSGSTRQRKHGQQQRRGKPQRNVECGLSQLPGAKFQ